MISLFVKLGQNQLLGSTARLREHLRIPLYRNAYLLILNQGLSAGLGLAYWMIAARFYSTEMVGQGSAIISTLGFLSALAELSLKSAMQRFVPRAGRHVSRLVLLTYGVIFVATGVFALGFFAIGRQLHFADSLVGGMSPTLLGLLLLAACLYTIFFVQDGVLMGLRQTLWVVLENTFYNLSKMLLLVLGTSGLLGNAIVASWFLPIPLVVLVVNGLVFGRFIPRFLQGRQTTAEPVQKRQVITSVTGDHVGTILSETSVRLIPLLIISLLGASQNAFYYQAWLIGSMLYLVSVNVSASFTVEGASNPGRIAHYSRQTLRQILLLMVPAALLLFAAAPLILGLYGQDYARQGAPLLRWLALAAIPYGINAWFLSFARVKADIKSIILAEGWQCVVVLGLIYAWLPRLGIVSAGVAWFIAQASISVFVFFKTRPVWFEKDRPDTEGGSRRPPFAPGRGRADGVAGRAPGVAEDPQRDDPTGVVYLFLSPHLDDAVLSCGGVISRLAAAGERVIIATIFTADVPQEWPISRFAARNLHAWQLDSASAFAERCAEDRAAAALLKAETLHLGLYDAMYRRDANGEPYYGHKSVGVAVDEADEAETGHTLRDELARLQTRLAGSAGVCVFCPLGIGGHVDHRILRSSAESVFGRESLIFYEDFPYTVRPENEHLLDGAEVENPTGRPAGPWEKMVFALTEAESEARVAASACYRSQISGLFPGPVERYLEIGSARLPLIGRPLFRIYRQVRSPRGSQKRMAASLKGYIARMGGETYWHVAPHEIAGSTCANRLPLSQGENEG